MNAVTPIQITTPDGVDRQLRFTLGARKRIQEIFGMDLQAALNKHDSAAFPGILFAMMHDAEGNPPKDVTLSQLSEMLDPGDGVEIMATILSAASQGKKTKDELIPILQAEMDRRLRLLTGSGSGASLLDLSVSPTSSSGGDTSNARSSLELIDSTNENVSGSLASAA